jgi:tetratricopeptide (TPR) repeat protein
MYANPANIAARRGFVMYYPRVGRLRDIIEEVIFLAQQLVESGAVDEGISYFQLALSVDPNNTVARDMLSATQSRHDAEVRRRTAQVDHSPISTTDTQDRSATGTGTRGRVVTAASDTPSDFLAGELDEIDAREERETLQQVVNNYRDIIAVNTLNAAVRVKLAEVLEQMGKRDEALKELALATEIFFRKDELPQCVNACEFFLTLNPRDQIIRKRLNEAILKRTAMKALESSILFAEDGDRPE